MIIECMGNVSFECSDRILCFCVSLRCMSVQNGKTALVVAKENGKHDVARLIEVCFAKYAPISSRGRLATLAHIAASCCFVRFDNSSFSISRPVACFCRGDAINQSALQFAKWSQVPILCGIRFFCFEFQKSIAHIFILHSTRSLVLLRFMQPFNFNGRARHADHVKCLLTEPCVI
jgi:hypothetical protein